MEFVNKIKGGCGCTTKGIRGGSSGSDGGGGSGSGTDGSE
jgi:hypothetical protein